MTYCSVSPCKMLQRRSRNVNFNDDFRFRLITSFRYNVGLPRILSKLKPKLSHRRQRNAACYRPNYYYWPEYLHDRGRSRRHRIGICRSLRCSCSFTSIFFWRQNCHCSAMAPDDECTRRGHVTDIGLHQL